MNKINTEAFDLALAGLESELNHTIVPIVAEAQRIADAMEQLRDFMESKGAKDE